MKNKKEFEKHFQKVLTSSFEEEPFMIEFLKSYIDKNLKSFQKKMVVWDEEEIIDYDLLSVLTSYSYRFSIPEGVIAFIKNSNEDTYFTLLNSYFTDLLLQTYAMKTSKFVNAVLHTDLALSTILSIGYFPDKTEYTASQLAAFLTSNKSRFEGYPPDLEFGFSSTLYLAYALLNDAGYEKSAQTIKEYVRKPDTSYEFAYKNLYSTDEDTVNNWIDQLANFHIINSSDDLTLAFNHERWQYFPIEMITLLQLRSQKGLSINFITHPLLKDFLPFIAQPLPIPLDETAAQLEKRILKN